VARFCEVHSMSGKLEVVSTGKLHTASWAEDSGRTELFEQCQTLVRELSSLQLAHDKLKSALIASRNQWIHSVSERQCLEALGEPLFRRERT
jgi:hypothetical protein